MPSEFNDSSYHFGTWLTVNQRGLEPETPVLMNFARAADTFVADAQCAIQGMEV